MSVQSLSSLAFPLIRQALLRLAVSVEKPILAVYHKRRGTSQRFPGLVCGFAERKIVALVGRLVASQTFDLVATIAHAIDATVVSLQIAPLFFRDQVVHAGAASSVAQMADLDAARPTKLVADILLLWIPPSEERECPLMPFPRRPLLIGRVLWIRNETAEVRRYAEALSLHRAVGVRSRLPRAPREQTRRTNAERRNATEQVHRFVRRLELDEKGTAVKVGIPQIYGRPSLCHLSLRF